MKGEAWMELLNDIRNYHSLKKDEKIYLICFLTAISSLLSVIDSIISRPFIIKIGLANIVSMILIYEGQYSLSFFVGTLRVIFSSLVTGSLFSFSFILSFSGFVFAYIFAVLSRRFIRILSIYGISVISSFFHIIGQSIWVFLFFGFTKTNTALVSIFLLVGIVTGLIVGYFSILFYKNLK
jgi:heptaprenyl diphosphate synthase